MTPGSSQSLPSSGHSTQQSAHCASANASGSSGSYAAAKAARAVVAQYGVFQYHPAVQASQYVPPTPDVASGAGQR